LAEKGDEWGGSGGKRLKIQDCDIHHSTRSEEKIEKFKTLCLVCEKLNPMLKID
jgi:hypothetical protein